MYNDIGEKIKSIAKVLAALCVVVGILLVLIGLVNFGTNAEYFGRQSGYGYEKAYYAEIGLRLIGYGVVTAVLGLFASWPLYGLGQLIKTNEEIKETNKEILRVIKGTANSTGAIQEQNMTDDKVDMPDF